MADIAFLLTGAGVIVALAAYARALARLS